MVNVQEWLDEKYPTENNKNKTTEIDSKNEEFEEGELILKDFPNLEIVDLSGGKGITKVTIVNCPKIRHLGLSNNKIARMVMTHSKCLDRLQRLELSMNKMTNLDPLIKQLPKLFVLACLNNPIASQRVNGSVTSDLVHFAGGIGVEKPIFWSAEKDYKERLKKIAESLGVESNELEDKNTSDVENAIKQRASKNNTANNKAKELQKEVDKLKGLLERFVSSEPQKSAEVEAPPKA